jgi:LPXTG-motif cell wall-anchored protein
MSFINSNEQMIQKINEVLRYDDNAPDVVVTTLKLINVPTEPKLPQTGDNANPLLYLGIGALALITGVGVGLRGRKKKNKQ